ncbi:shikimate kinase [Luteococcus peritonei]|uniref:Shikimate kinase n=1 Tax=Luteococcus peritonei TaxID=88874 RepID=A0ABW4RZC4_9ACTN
MAEPTPRLPETIVLVGAPGAGKSTIGARLARRLGMDFTDVDELIEQRAGKPIPEIFLMDGEPAFRELERETTLELVGRPGIVSLGGGAVMNPLIRQALAERTVVWLDVSAHHASRRVGLTGNSRPLLAGGNVHSTMVRLMNERLPLYREVSTHRIDTNGLKPAAVVRELLARLGVDDPEQPEPVQDDDQTGEQ